ncbi:hypothetical protein ZEAMMB73_Zm00001d029374 [Zea mays]|uniref:Uncharacterized protein n=1 Tax=Zea mays TaxID=4577 RepID=A0A1D6K4N8_MAIZE|nr:hypothetical protein ZEAMMB73_Zm00001d029374 [Zea mays]
MELDAPPPAAAVAIPPAGSDKHKGFERMKFARAGSEPLAKIQMHHSKMNPRIMRMGHRRYDPETHNLSVQVEFEDQSNVNQVFSACKNDSPFEFVGLRSMKIKHTPVMFRWNSGRNHTSNPWKIHGDLIPSWITPPRGDVVLPQFRESRECVVEKCKVVIKNNEKTEGLWGKKPESGILWTEQAESAHLSSPQNPKSPTHGSSPAFAPKPQIEKFVGHFWGRSQRSYASVVKTKRAPIVAVKMQPRGAGRRGAARGYGRGSGRDHVWRRIEDGDVQNQRGGRSIEEVNMGEGGDTLNQAAKRSKYEGKMQKDKKVDYGNMEDGNIKQHDECSRKSQSYTYQMQGLDKNVSKEKNVGTEEGKTGKSYSSCSGEEKNKVHITDSEEDDDSDLLGEELMAMKNRGSGSNSLTMWNTQSDPVDNLNSRNINHIKSSKCSVILEELDTNEKGVDNSEELFSGTQGSSIVNASQEEGDDLSDQRKKTDGIIYHEGNQKVMPSPIPVRRVSERLKKDMGIKIEEKNRRMAVKRNLEGNSCIPEPIFSCLASKEIIDISKKMGVNINEQNMESIELLKEMELARQCLGQKKIEILQKKR